MTMSLKCSVFGHRFGEAEVTREREEEGSEVVITIRETERCQRCGETRVVSTNREVTTLETPSDIVGDEDDGPAGDDPATEASATDDPATDAAEAPSPSTEVPDAGPEPAAAEDAELIEEAEGAGGGAHAGEPESDAWTGGQSATETRDPSAEDAVILDEDQPDESERAPGEWPEEEEEDDDWAPDIEPETRPVGTDGTELEPTSEAVAVPEGEFHCPECGFTTAVESSSLRQGDFCPECHRGALTHRTGE